jgi:hypothetical protein
MKGDISTTYSTDIDVSPLRILEINSKAQATLSGHVGRVLALVACSHKRESPARPPPNNKLSKKADLPSDMQEK